MRRALPTTSTEISSTPRQGASTARRATTRRLVLHEVHVPGKEANQMRLLYRSQAATSIQDDNRHKQEPCLQHMCVSTVHQLWETALSRKASHTEKVQRKIGTQMVLRETSVPGHAIPGSQTAAPERNLRGFCALALHRIPHKARTPCRSS